MLLPSQQASASANDEYRLNNFMGKDELTELALTVTSGLAVAITHQDQVESNALEKPGNGMLLSAVIADKNHPERLHAPSNNHELLSSDLPGFFRIVFLTVCRGHHPGYYARQYFSCAHASRQP